MNSEAGQRLWLLRPRAEVLAAAEHPWEPSYDKVFGLVVRAASEREARWLAQPHAGYEGLGIYRRFGQQRETVATHVWLDPSQTECEPLEASGSPAVILIDRRQG